MKTTLEEWRAVYLKNYEEKIRHHFDWTMKKTEAEPEEDVFLLGGLMINSGRYDIQQEAKKSLIEGIEEWLKPKIELIPLERSIPPFWFYKSWFGW